MLTGPTASTGHVSGQVRGVHHSSLFVPRTELPTEQVLRRRLLSAVSSRAADAWKDVDAWTMAPVIPTGENRHRESGHSGLGELPGSSEPAVGDRTSASQ